jgi:hypothetical protein
MLKLLIILLFMSTPIYANCPYNNKCNRITGSVGVGQQGTRAKKINEVKTKVTSSQSVVLGIHYERKLLDHSVIGFGVVTNGTYLIKVGKDF